jgi:hypothetical protein
MKKLPIENRTVGWIDCDVGAGNNTGSMLTRRLAKKPWQKLGTSSRLSCLFDSALSPFSGIPFSGQWKYFIKNPLAMATWRNPSHDCPSPVHKSRYLKYETS